MSLQTDGVHPKASGQTVNSSDWNKGFEKVDELDGRVGAVETGKVSITGDSTVAGTLHLTGLSVSTQVITPLDVSSLLVDDLTVRRSVGLPRPALATALGMYEYRIPTDIRVRASGYSSGVVVEQYPVNYGLLECFPAFLRIQGGNQSVGLDVTYTETIMDAGTPQAPNMVVRRTVHLSQGSANDVFVRGIVFTSIDPAVFTPFTW